jgi:hypothetical protein
MADQIPPTSSDPLNNSSAGLSQEGEWAAPMAKLKLTASTEGAVNINVDGRQVTNPLQGFGQLWQKTYKIRLSDVQVSPQEVIRVWKTSFPEFWPKGNRFYGSLQGIRAGEVALINLAGPGGMTAPGGGPLISTGVYVIYSDDESFSFLTPEGHMFNGMITFSSTVEDSTTVVQVQALIRASDPVYELGFRMGFGHKAEDEFWKQTLRNLASRFDVQAEPTQQNILIDPRTVEPPREHPSQRCDPDVYTILRRLFAG